MKTGETVLYPKFLPVKNLHEQASLPVSRFS
jgi:hypothetical protein